MIPSIEMFLEIPLSANRISFSDLVLMYMFSNGSAEEETLGMIKPDGLLGNYTERIKRVIIESGFSISKEITTQLDEELASTFYAEHSSKGFFPNLIKYMTRYLYVSSC